MRSLLRKPAGAVTERKKVMAKDKNPDSKSSFDPEIKKGIVIALAIVLLFSSGNLLGSLMSAGKTVETASSAAQTTAAQTTAATTPATTQAPAPDTTAPAADSTAPANNDTTAAKADTTAPANNGSSTGAPSSTADILKLFNESANKIKTNASKVTRNYQDYQHNEDKTELPSALQSIGKPLISKFLTKNETPVEYTGADITANYPVAGESYVSQATEADIESATCDDDGTSYNIVLKFKDCTDPAAGTGCASAFTTIKESDVKGNAPVVQSFSNSFFGAQIECKIDKATGNMTWARYTLPMVLSVTAKVLVTIDAKVGMTFIDDYSIAY